MTIHLTIITGSSRGLGAALVAQRLQPGQRVLGLARKVNASLQAAAAGAAQPGALLEQWPVDLADAAPVALRLAGWLQAQGGATAATLTLINNAGMMATPAPLDRVSSDGLVQALRVGLEAPLLLTAAFLDATRHWPGARRVLNISSGLGRQAMAGSAVYCAAKAGMDHLTRALALEQAAQSNPARVASMAPGVIDTDMQAELRASDAALFPERARFVALQAQGQLLTAAACAARVLALLERADFGQQTITDIRQP